MAIRMRHTAADYFSPAAGTLRRPIDIFDFFLHTVPLVLLSAKATRMFASGR